MIAGLVIKYYKKRINPNNLYVLPILICTILCYIMQSICSGFTCDFDDAKLYKWKYSENYKIIFISLKFS